MYECETSSLTVREEQLGCQNRKSRRVSGSKREKVTGCSRKLQNLELDQVVLFTKYY
jgi:hypothetical protein